MLRIWLDLNGITKSIEVDPPKCEVIWVREQDPYDASNSRTASRNWLRNCYASAHEVERRIAAGAYDSPEDLFRQEKFPSATNIMVRHGDFGEAVGHFVLEAHPHFQFCLPIYRLRSKDDKEKSHFGFDLIGFTFAEETAGGNTLCIGEAKLRTTRDDNAIAEAHTTLSGYSRSREIEQVGRIAHLLLEQRRDAEADKLARFGDGWGKQEFDRRHVAIGVLDSSMPLQGVFDALNGINDLLPTFVLCLVLVKDLRQKVEEAFNP